MTTTKPTIQQLRKLQASPAAFRQAIVIDTDTGPKRLANVIEPWQAVDFSAMDGGWQVCVGQKPDDGAKVFHRGYLERARGHDKTGGLAVQISWALFASRRKLSGICSGADRDQARLLRDAVQRLTLLNPWLADYVQVQDVKLVNARNRIDMRHHRQRRLFVLWSHPGFCNLRRTVSLGGPWSAGQPLERRREAWKLFVLNLHECRCR